MSEISYQTPAGALAGAPEQPGGLYRGVVFRGGTAHPVVVIRDAGGGEVLVSGPTFFGWIACDELIRDADEEERIG